MLKNLVKSLQCCFFLRDRSLFMAGGKSGGGGYEIFLMDREWARKKIEKARVGVEIFLPRKFSPLARHLSFQ